MCHACAAEYHDPTDRRYHAQPVACPACGPRLRFERPGASVGTVEGTDAALAAVHAELAAGRVVAIKGLGGYHLAVDATSDAAVGLLRQRKGRVDKPFAVMLPDLDAVRSVAGASAAEAEALTSPARPIVLLRRRVDAELSTSIAPGSPLVGVMLPYTPLHHLLFEPVPGGELTPPRAIVLTSGNRSNEPICFDDDDARSRLADLADAIFTHDRPIEVPCDDSVVRIIDGELQPVRRSRGYAPIPIALPVEVAPVLGAGGELKNTCCLASGRHAWVGQHVGDMENLQTLEAFTASVDAFSRMYRVEPVAIGADRHPGYLTRRWALERDAAGTVDVQHHHAHVVAAMVEHGLDGSEPVLGFAFDGTGYGTDADGTVQIWGGEVLLADLHGFERLGHLAPLPLPGGDEAIRNPCRIALAYAAALGIELDERIPAFAAADEVERRIVARQVERGVGCVPTTSMGRLFDAVASLLGVRHRISYEAQAAIELEVLAESGAPGAVPLAFGLVDDGTIDPRPVVAGVVAAVHAGRPPADIALAFHGAVADIVATIADTVLDRIGGTRHVVLTGGVFQNGLLIPLTGARLAGAGIQALTHRLVPPNDGGLSLGQAVVAGIAASATPTRTDPRPRTE